MGVTGSGLETGNIRLQAAGKRFLRSAAPGGRTLKDALFGGLRGQAASAGHWVLRDLDISIEAGEIVGLVGANGTGKSTLLKLIAGIMRPSCGQVVLRGRVAALLQEGTGFHPELTARENLLLRCALLGLDRQQARARLDAIVAFADAAAVLEQPVKHLSTGMRMRLAWSVSVHLAADIYLVDEIFSVVDAAFAQRCIEHMRRENRERRCTILLVSHMPQVIEALCTRILWLDQGGVALDSRDVPMAMARYGASVSVLGGA